MLELADETDSKSVVRKGVWVRAPPPAYIQDPHECLMTSVHADFVLYIYNLKVCSLRSQLQYLVILSAAKDLSIERELCLCLFYPKVFLMIKMPEAAKNISVLVLFRNLLGKYY